ncbi:zinc finger protein 677-like [Trichogramma pretiosum]|uniref:zinc finger protein 677-like n=1 Tax=Trichogramma pretiosum TaxID=7493 RepID=UPI000C71C4BB|nr:zinc finger protein 677-like [Trichogramma pretiosum]
MSQKNTFFVYQGTGALFSFLRNRSAARSSRISLPEFNETPNLDTDGSDSETSSNDKNICNKNALPLSFALLPSQRFLPGVSHEQQRKFRCRFCGKGYRWKSTMRRHETVECGGKPPAYQRPKCPYKARQRGNLTVHYKRHHQKIANFSDTR